MCSSCSMYLYSQSRHFLNTHTHNKKELEHTRTHTLTHTHAHTRTHTHTHSHSLFFYLSLSVCLSVCLSSILHTLKKNTPCSVITPAPKYNCSGFLKLCATFGKDILKNIYLIQLSFEYGLLLRQQNIFHSSNGNSWWYLYKGKMDCLDSI